MDNLLLGGFLALLLRGSHAANLLRWARTASLIAFGAVLVWFVFTPAHHFRGHPYPYPASLHTWVFSAIAILSGLLILLAIQPDTLIYRVFNLAPLRWMGRISYGAYVFHDIFHLLYVSLVDRFCAYLTSHHEPLNSVLWAHRDRFVALVALVVTFLLAWLSFRFYESLFLNLKERWTIREGA